MNQLSANKAIKFAPYGPRTLVLALFIVGVQAVEKRLHLCFEKILRIRRLQDGKVQTLRLQPVVDGGDQLS